MLRVFGFDRFENEEYTCIVFSVCLGVRVLGFACIKNEEYTLNLECVLVRLYGQQGFRCFGISIMCKKVL